MHTEYVIGSFLWGFSGVQVILLGVVWIKLKYFWMYFISSLIVFLDPLSYFLLIFFAALSTSCHRVLKGIHHMVYLVGVFAHWYSVVIVAGSSISPTLVLGFLVPLIFFSSGFLGVRFWLDCLKLLGECQDIFLCLC